LTQGIHKTFPASPEKSRTERLHNLRHTHTTMLLARGAHPKIIKEQLRYSSITITLDLYGHLVPGLQEPVSTLNGPLSKKAL